MDFIDIGIIIAYFIILCCFTIVINRGYKVILKDILFAFLFSFAAVKLSNLIQTLLFLLYEKHFPNKTYWLDIIFNSFISSALVEESIKLLLFYLFAKLVFSSRKVDLKNNEKANHVFFLAIFFGFIFATFENIAYFIHDISSIKIRLFTTSFLHATIAVYYWKILTKNKKIAFFIQAWLLHAFFNFFLNLNIYFALFSVLILFYLLRKAGKEHKKIAEEYLEQTDY